MTVYHMINWFFTFSFMGYLLECAVLSFENKKPVFNRGFSHGPFCIIYGFGALGAYFILSPFADRPVWLYFLSLFMATSMELVTANVMIKLFGGFWWDYSKKPFNYHGIVCLESSIAWGFLGIFFFRFLDGLVNDLVARVPIEFEKRVAVGLVVFYMLDFIYCFRQRISENEKEDIKPAVDEETGVIERIKWY